MISHLLLRAHLPPSSWNTPPCLARLLNSYPSFKSPLLCSSPGCFEVKGPRRALFHPHQGGLAYTRRSIRECYRSDLPLGIERKSRNRRSIGVQTCAKGQGTGGESKGCDPKKVPWGRGWGGVSAHACRGGRELSLFMSMPTCYVPLFFQPRSLIFRPTPPFSASGHLVFPRPH